MIVVFVLGHTAFVENGVWTTQDAGEQAELNAIEATRVRENYQTHVDLDRQAADYLIDQYGAELVDDSLHTPPTFDKNVIY